MNKVDVLAVMDRLIENAENTDDFGFIAVPVAHEARAAVAELIEAARGSLGAAPGAAQVNADMRLMAAIASCGGV